jgi:hypothetical protein
MMNYSKRQGKGEKRGSPPTDYVLKPRDREIQCSAGFLDGIQIESTERKSGKKRREFYISSRNRWQEEHTTQRGWME